MQCSVWTGQRIQKKSVERPSPTPDARSVTKQSQKLRKDFCPPIDEPAFYAICSDYDLKSHEGLSACMRDLEIIRAAANEVDITSFDASGTGGFVNRDLETSGESGSSHSGTASRSQEVDSITIGLSELAWDDPSAKVQYLDDAGEEAKVSWLKTMFPDFAEDKICYRLQKCEESLTRAIDELLNLSFIDQNAPEGQAAIPKGIDGFTQIEHHGRGRKAKGRRRMRTNESTRSSSTNANGPTEATNAWTAMAGDVEFICARTTLDPGDVRSIYDAQNKSLANTIRSIAGQEAVGFNSIEALDSLEQARLAQLSSDFPAVPLAYLNGLLAVSNHMLSAAHELAVAMAATPKQSSDGKLQIIPRYAPIDLGSDAETRNPQSSSSWSQINHSNAQSLAMVKAAAGSAALSQASNAYRKGKSDHLMGGAAAYYAAVGRENVKAAKELSSLAADSLVMSQSNSDMLDLHGVSVADAVRIAKEQVALWWYNLGDTKYATGGGGRAREGYRIVTGVGRHSRDGAPKIGPAVSRMLVGEGWKVAVGQGEILITGKARRS